MQPNFPHPTYNDNFQKSVLEELMSLDNRLNKPDSIGTLSNLTMKQSNMNVRVTSLKGTVRNVDARVKDVETSRAPEEPSPAARRSENCAKTVLDYLDNT
ncbi:hypothetical protein DPMN_058001 [Dreissena polymorpha]|uniref:Uncharacterized protein n=1 Tax=Dreissena polymorpha TaxID=45954 RepID=A0A9D4HCX7_DREPO|nr:hypothetical protein DPMN_058001 [Dreissena polymorpha]